MTNLEKYLYQLRRIEEHRSKGAEKEIRKIYKQLLKDINSYLADIYLNYSEDDMLTFGNLAKVGMDARFLEEVEQRINGISPQVAKTINDTVTQSYEACYDGMRNAVVKAAGSRELLRTALSTVAAVTPEVIRAAVNNPVSGLTLKDTLEKHRKEIIYDIKRNIGVGLSNGDRFTTMAKRISQSLDSDYNKSIRIVRTEAHRIREAGFHDAATSIHETLQQGNSGYVMAKTWKTMDDERVRPNTVYKTKKGWKKGKKSKYNHEKMDGITIPQDQEFELPSGSKGKAPGQIGVAGEDINCRCYLSYDLVEVGILYKGKNAFVDGGSKDGLQLLGANSNSRSGNTTRIELGQVDIKDIDLFVNEFSEQIRNSDIENALVIDKNGNAIQFISNTDDSVYIFDVDLDGAIVLHNHPSTNGILSFGEDDFLFLRENQTMKSFRCCNEEYDYSVNVLKDMSNLVYNGLYREAMENYIIGEDIQHMTFEVMKQKGYVNYERKEIFKY